MKCLRNKIIRTLASLSAMLLLVTSCEVGMGSAVDTEPPLLVINSPVAASIIRGDFLITGTWTDDQEVDKALCTLTNTENKEIKYFFDGKVKTDDKGKGNWSILVDTSFVKDGNYEAAVSVFDGANHETREVRQFVIDNTPPVIILKRPSSRKGEQDSNNIDGYGQLFTLNGLAADDSGVGLIEVNIYNDEALNNLVKTISAKNVPNTISLDVAEFIEGETNDYSIIYGSTSRSAGEQKRWCKVIAYDGAQYFPIDGKGQTEEDKKGNAATAYYLYEDLSATLLKNYKITDLYSMLNGNYSGERSAVNSVISTLDEKKIEAGVFTLNPANNPSYTVSGYQELKKDGTDFGEAMSVRNGNSLVITVKPGLDSYEIKPETLCVYLQQCDNNGNGIGNLIPMTNITKEQSGTSYIITVPVNKDENINIGKNYLLHVEGLDEKSIPVEPKGNGYGFSFVSNGVKPTLKVTDPASAAIVSKKASDDSITITGTVKFPSDTCEEGTVLIKDSTGNLEWNVGSFDQLDYENNWSITLHFGEPGANYSPNNPYLPDGNHTLLVYAITGTNFAEAGNSVYVERNIKVDTQIPAAPAISTLKGAAFDSAKWYDSASLSAVVNAIDTPKHGYASGLAKTEYRIGATGNWTSLATTTGGFINGLAEGENTVYLRSVDFVENPGTEKTETIKVDTILPKITKASIGEGTSWDELTSGSIENIPDSHGKKLQLEIEEEHIREEAEDKGITVTLITPNDSDPSNPTRTSLSGTLTQNANGSGKHKWESTVPANLTPNKTITIEVLVRDQVERENPTSAQYKVLVDTLPPIIEPITPATNLEGTNSLTTATNLQVNIRDTAGTVAETKYLLTQTELTNVLTSARGSSWKESASKGVVTVNTNDTAQTGLSSAISSGKWYFYIYSKDDAGNESTLMRYFWFDSLPPVLGISDPPLTKSTYNSYDKASTESARNTVKASGTASDLNGIKSVQYKLDNNEWKTVASNSTGQNLNWSITLEYPKEIPEDEKLAEGNHTLIIRATDKADKITEESYSILIDTELPVITFADTDDNWHNSARMDADITVEDATSPINFVYYSIGDTNPGVGGNWPNLFTYNSTTKKATGAIEFENNGANTVYVNAVDKAGNESISSFIRKVDTEINSFNAKYSQMGADGAINRFGGTTYVNGDTGMTFWGDISDSLSGVDRITLRIDDNNPSTEDGITATIKYSASQLPALVSTSTPLPADYVNYAAENATTIKSWKAVVDGSQFKTGKLIVTAYDNAGNEVDAQEILNIDFDQNPPAINTETISITSASTDSNTKKYAYRNSATALEYFVNPAAVYTIKGVSSDDKGMASTKLVIGDNTYTSSSASAWTFTINDLSSYSGNSVTAKIIATDVAGNTTEKNILLKFDNKPPVISGDLKINGSVYAEGQWSTKTVLTANGSLTDSAITDSDTGSGPAKLYFKRYATEDLALTGAETTGFITDYRSSRDGVITAGITYTGSVTGLKDGKNYLLFVAEDNVGNAKLLSATPYYVCVDEKSPIVEANAESSGTKFSNGSTAVTVSGSCSDPDSGTTDSNTGISNVITGGSTVQSITVSVVVEGAEKSVTVTPVSGAWTATISADDLAGIVHKHEYDIKVTAKDLAGNESSALKIATLKGDKNAPTASLNSIVQSVETGSGDNKKFYVKPDTALTVKGITEEDVSTTVYTWLKLVPYTAGSEASPIELDANKTTARSWTLTIPANTLASSYTGAKLYVCTKDLAGNEKSYEKANLEFDTTAPARLTESTNTKFVPYKVADKNYNAENFYNSENLIFTGSWEDEQAGVSTLYYEIIPPNATATITTTNLDETITNADGSISSKYDPFTVKNEGAGLYTFSREIRGFESGINHLKMYAKDALGNISEPWEATVKIDTVEPSASVYTDTSVDPAYTYSFTNSYLTDGRSDKTLYFYASDAAAGSGIDTSLAPVITLGRTELTTVAAPESANGSKASYAVTETAGSGYLVTVILKQADLTSGYQPVVVTIADKAGNKARINLGSMDVDTEDPTVTLKSPADADTESEGVQVNGIITIKGTAADKNLKTRPLTKLEYSSDGTSWTDLITDFSTGNTNITNAAEFSVKIDTTDTSKFTDGSTYQVRATVEDEAGRSKTSTPVTFTVDQDTDRPVITFMDISVPAIAADATENTTANLKLVNSKKLRVTVTDDDGVASFETKVGSDILTPASSRNGTYVYNLPDSVIDGTYDVVFTVVDSAEGESSQRTFTSASSKAPKLTDGTNKMNKATAPVKLMLDSIAPVTEKTEYAYYTGSYNTANLTDSSWSETVPALGGTREKLAIRIKAGDENKIDKVAAVITKTDGTAVSTASVVRDSTVVDTQNESDETDHKYYSTWIIKDIDVSKTKIPADGNYKLELTITDGVENTKTDSVQINIDWTPPDLRITSPQAVTGDNTTYSSGSLKANGSIIGAKTLRYVVSQSNDTENPPAAADYSDPIDFSTTWTINFDGDTTSTTGIHTYLLNDWLVRFNLATLANLNDGSYITITPIYLWLKAEDEVGNITETPYPILVNPQGDRPTIKINYPQEHEQVFGKSVSIYGTHQDTIGTSTDKIGVKSAWVQIISQAQKTVITDLTGRLAYTPKTTPVADESKRISAFAITKQDLDYLASVKDGNQNPVYEIYNMKTYKGDGTDKKWAATASATTINEKETINGVAYDYTDYAILAKISGAAWNLTINSQGEFNPLNDEQAPKRNIVAIQVYAKDGDGKLNTVAENKYVFFDNNTPLIEDLELEQYDSSGKLISKRNYTPDMYISYRNDTTWKLRGKVWHKTKIQAYSMSEYQCADDAEAGIVNTDESKYFLYPLTKSGTAGTISLTITATDYANHTGEEEISIRFDDQAPVLVTSGSDYNINTIIQQNNGFYKFGSIAKEDPASDGTTQSGFAYTAFYFMRGTKLYDILKSSSLLSANPSAEGSGFTYDSSDHLYWYKKTVTTRENAVNVLSLESDQNMNGIRKNALVKVDGAFYRVTDFNTNTKTFTIDGTPVKSTTTVYVAAAGLIDNTAKEKAKDGASPETSDGYYAAGNLDFDDGDRMVEYVYKSGTSWEWEASVYSKNIADGPVKLVYVVFDQAGNFTSQSIDAIICNNTPRIAGFSVYTDYNNNGTVNDAGKDGMYEAYLASTYSAKSVTGTIGTGDNIKNVYNPDAKSSDTNQKNPLKNKITAYKEDPDDETARLPVMTLRGKTVIIPEIVGGNGDVFYDYSIRGTTGSGTRKLFEGSTDYTINSKAINIQLGDLVSIGDVNCTEFKFTFRDSMEDRAKLDTSDYSFTAAQKEEVNAYLSVYMGIAAAASNPPVVKINPFYWNSIKDNSIYLSGGKVDADNPSNSIPAASSYKDLKGHIELEDDWTAQDTNGNYVTSYTATTTSGQYDADPKVSGQVVVTGTVHDDNLISKIHVKYGSFIDKDVATFASGALTTTSDATGTGYEFKLGTQTFSATGHDVEWTLYLNTETVGGTTIAATDVALTVTAANLGTPSCTPSDAVEGDSEEILNIAGNKKYAAATYDPESVQTNTPGTTNTSKTAKTAYYRMDIVPYITDVQTSLSSANKNNHSVYSRTALGHYPVYMTHAQGNTPTAFEQGIKVYGFNLAGGSITLGGTSDNTETLTANSGYYTFNLPSGAKKGAATVTVGTGANAVSSLNNINNDNSRGDYKYTVAANGTRTDNLGTVSAEGDYTKYTNFYNRMPNKANNNNLTDNVYFDVWDFNTQAAMAHAEGKVDNAVMKINPISGMIGFAFSNGSERFSMGGNVSGTEYSYHRWNRSYDYMGYNSFTYASDGHSFGSSVGGDINASNESNIRWDFTGLMSDRWGVVGNEPGSNKTGDHFIRYDGIGQWGSVRNISSGAGETNVRKDRFKSANLEVQRTTDNATGVYYAFYDLLNDEIRFKAGKLLDTNGNTSTNPTTFGQFPTHARDDKDTYKKIADNSQIIASNYSYDTGEPAASAAYDKSHTLGRAGEYVDIAVTSNNVVVLVWYNKEKLMYTYNENPFELVSGPVGNDQTEKNGLKVGWKAPMELFTGGEYCQIEVAADNSIHVVAYDPSSSSLKYAYLPSYSSTDKKVCTVDSYLDTGTQLSLDVAAERINGTVRYIPHIGYWAAYPEKPRYAYLADPTTFFSATTEDERSGAVRDKFTTVWECGVVPVATGTAVKEGKVNIGLWKATVIPEGTETAVEGYRVASNNAGFSIGTSEAATDMGKCYGNGTGNAVLAYVTMPSSSTYYIETAQMR